MKMHICYFGTYNREYSRNSIFLKGLRLNGVKVTEINFKPTISHYLKSFFKINKLDYDVFLVGYSYNQWLENFFAKLSSRKPIFWDAFISQYDTKVFNLKTVRQKSVKASLIYYRELFSLKCADCIILDTTAHINYFKKIYPLKKAKYERVYVGADDSIAFPQQVSKSSDVFTIFFYGNFAPLHGIEYILKAAKVLQKDKQIVFKIVGGGYRLNYVKKIIKQLELTNVELTPPVPYKRLIELMNSADICLGIFGRTKKADNIIPNKVYDALAQGKPLITGESSAIKEVLEKNINCQLCERGDSSALVDSILSLKEDPELRKSIASNGYSLFKKRFTPKHIGKSLIHVIEKHM